MAPLSDEENGMTKSRNGHKKDIHTSKGSKRDSISHWDQYKTVSWRTDDTKDFKEHTSMVMQDDSYLAQAWHELPSWGIPAMVGILTAFSGAFIEKNVEWFGALRLGYCPSHYFYTTPENCPTGWVAWENGYLMFIIVTTALCTVSATLTWAFAPMSRGSGIPEVKMILGGFNFEEALAGNTLIVKIIGLSISVGAGLSCGKEGPLVHIACGWSHFLAKFFKRYKENDAKQRELLSCACAAGVTIAFGAPLGGVLFSYEEASTLFPSRTMLRAFFGASIAAVTLVWINVTGSGMLTMFNAPYRRPPEPIEYIVVVLLGIVGGLIGAAFVHFNLIVSRARAPGTAFRKRCHIVLEVAIIGFITGLTSYYLLQTKVISNIAIRALFHDCKDPDLMLPSVTQAQFETWEHNFMLDICDGHGPGISMHIAATIALTGLIKWGQMVITFGTGAAAGLFIPNLLVGACLGRVVGIGMYNLNEKYHFAGFVCDDAGVCVNNIIQPGLYAMLGAASVLGGACRVTISLVVIFFELTGALQVVVPYMIVCTLAKWVGDRLTLGIYDELIRLRKYPYLHEPDEEMHAHTAKDFMEEMVDCLYAEAGSIKKLYKSLKAKKHGGYPLIRSETDRTLLGYVHADPLLQYLSKKRSQSVGDDTPVVFRKFVGGSGRKVLDVSRFCDTTEMTIVADTTAVQITTLFRNLGLKVILVREEGRLIGMITKKLFIKQMEEFHQSDHAVIATTKVGLHEALLPK